MGSLTPLTPGRAFQMGCAQGCSFSENITVPDTKVNFYTWKRMDVSLFFPSSWGVSFWEPEGVLGRTTEEDEGWTQYVRSFVLCSLFIHAFIHSTKLILSLHFAQLGAWGY